MANDEARHQPSGLLPTDPFDTTLRDLTGLPNGAHTQPTTITESDEYGNATTYIVRTVRWDKGNTIFIEQVSARGSARFILPPKVAQTIGRQDAAVSTMIRRRHGKRLAEERRASGYVPTFTPEMRAKGLKTRKAKAARRRLLRAGK